METLDVPEVTQMPKLARNESDPATFADMVLTSLFRHESALLHAEYRPPGSAVTWFIRPIRDGTEQTDVPVAVSNSCGEFRAVLARFGHHYMGGQLYHGFALRFLCQHDKVHRCLIYTSNMGQSGFWIRVYAAVV